METRELNSDDSSTSEEENKNLHEAVDPDFLTENLYKNNTSEVNNEKSSKPPPSLRNQQHQKVSINPFSIKVTPEFQKHVSKHLTKLLDKIIVDKDVVLKIKKVKKKKHLNHGVKLLKNSKDYLTCNKNEIQTVPVRNVKSENFNDSENLRKAKEVAVTPDWVLSKQETKYWSPSTKGEVEIVNINNDNKGKCKIKIKNKKKMSIDVERLKK